VIKNRSGGLIVSKFGQKALPKVSDSPNPDAGYRCMRNLCRYLGFTESPIKISGESAK
jgi:hypothetical protein